MTYKLYHWMQINYCLRFKFKHTQCWHMAQTQTQLSYGGGWPDVSPAEECESFVWRRRTQQLQKTGMKEEWKRWRRSPFSGEKRSLFFCKRGEKGSCFFCERWVFFVIMPMFVSRSFFFIFHWEIHIIMTLK